MITLKEFLPSGRFSWAQFWSTQKRDEPKRGSTEEEYEEWYSKKQDVEKVCNKFLEYGECVSIEFDSEAMTATVK